MTTQWHPLFAELLRSLVQPHYEVRTNVPVGDAPRQADLVLLRRTAAGPLPFRGLWRHLKPWNILEFKGPTVRPRQGDLDRLVELGLGIHRHLNDERTQQHQRPLPPEQVSFWYLANHLGQRFLQHVRTRAGELEEIGAGQWRCEILQRLVFLVSGRDLPLEEDSVPLHLIGQEPPAADQALAEFLVARPALWQLYEEWLAALHESAYRRVASMARTRTRPFEISIAPLVESLGVPELVRRIGLNRVVEEVGLKRVVDEVGLKRVVDEVGLKRVVDEVGLKRVVDEVGLEELAIVLTPAQRRQLKDLLS